jgi:hypothetical protein
MAKSEHIIKILNNIRNFCMSYDLETPLNSLTSKVAAAISSTTSYLTDPVKIFSKLFFLFVALDLAAQESPSKRLEMERQILFDCTPKIEQVKNRKAVAFGSLSVVPGGGVSYRTRDCDRGRAFDFKLAHLRASPGFISNPEMYISMADYNFIYYRNGVNENAPYLSWGVGVLLFYSPDKTISPIPLPYIPIRAGYEFKYGFIDIGAKLPVPLPEIRAGIGFQF